jgi:hypothetical protein
MVPTGSVARGVAVSLVTMVVLVYSAATSVTAARVDASSAMVL